MTTKEQQAIDRLLKAVEELRSENKQFRQDVTLQVDSINAKTDKKHAPVYLEQDILKTAQEAVGNALRNILQDSYSSPLRKLVLSVVEEHSDELRTLISESFVQVIRKDEFKQAVLDAFSHKVARSVISSGDGLFDKVVNGLKQDPVFKSKVTLAVANIVSQYTADGD